MHVSSVATSGHGLARAHPARPCWVSRRSEEFFGDRGIWRTDSATNLRRKAFDNCKPSVFIWLQTPRWSHWDFIPGPRWGTPSAHPDFRAWLRLRHWCTYSTVESHSALNFIVGLHDGCYKPSNNKGNDAKRFNASVFLASWKTWRWRSSRCL